MPVIKIARGWKKFKLIRELALAEKPQRQLALEYGVTEVSISTFKKNNAPEIAAARLRMDDEFSHIPIANKANRIAEYQAILEEAEGKDGEGWAEARRIAALALKSVAEELGHLPNRQTISVEGRVDYVLIDPDAEDLT